MVLREVKPLSDKQWKPVIESLEAGPTSESIRAIKKSLKIANRIKER